MPRTARFILQSRHVVWFELLPVDGDVSNPPAVVPNRNT